MPQALRVAPLAFVASLLLLVAAVGGNVAAVHRADVTPSHSPFGGGDITANHTVLHKQLDVPPGATLRVDAGALREVVEQTSLPLHFYVVEGGYQDDFQDGNVPPHYLHVPPGELDDLSGYAEVVRQPTPELTPDPPFDSASRDIALVWYLEHDEERQTEVASMSDDERRQAFHEMFRVLPEPGLGHGDIIVTAGWLRWAQPLFYTAQGILILGTIISGVWFLRARNRNKRGLDEGEGPTEALVRAIELVEDYLTRFRNLLIILGVVLATGGLLIPLAVSVGPENIMRALSPNPQWMSWIKFVAWFAYLVMLAVWAGLLLQVQRELTRWRNASAEPPLEM